MQPFACLRSDTTVSNSQWPKVVCFLTSFGRSVSVPGHTDNVGFCSVPVTQKKGHDQGFERFGGSKNLYHEAFLFLVFGYGKMSVAHGESSSRMFSVATSFYTRPLWVSSISPECCT